PEVRGAAPDAAGWGWRPPAIPAAPMVLRTSSRDQCTTKCSPERQVGGQHRVVDPGGATGTAPGTDHSLYRVPICRRPFSRGQSDGLSGFRITEAGLIASSQVQLSRVSQVQYQHFMTAVLQELERLER